jgi:hypothetical protein
MRSPTSEARPLVQADHDKPADATVEVGPGVAGDAAIVLGLASTALPFAGTTEAQAERWLRVLRLQGAAGAALQALGVSEAPLSSGGEGADHRPRGHDGDPEIVDRVSERAVEAASRRGAHVVETTDVLMAVMHVYGADFDRVLQAHGTDRDELLERLRAEAHAAG